MAFSSSSFLPLAHNISSVFPLHIFLTDSNQPSELSLAAHRANPTTNVKYVDRSGDPCSLGSLFQAEVG